MMNNLFSIFDPTSSLFKIQLNWISILIPMFILQMNFWMLKSQSSMVIMNFMVYFKKEIKQLMNNPTPMLIFISMMMMIFLNNFMGLFPYIFNATSHITFTLSLALFSWLSLNLFTLIMKTTNMLIHMVPIGTPMLLLPFMVIVESISNIIRPITLSIRLMANMTAGHILISLMSNMCVQTTTLITIFTIISQCLLMIMELAVALIQAYVFTTLLSMYYNEI
uniref:ATP synthase subunit a n=1 Tax=Tanystylum sp. JZ-2022 TaxID=2992008 RepID=A0A9E7V871_9CHEL|nr:ATP synthase F0 subunit 6 [Tanystylum sp. JZ-2022]